MNVKKSYLRPECIFVNCELTNVILADSQPLRSTNNYAEDSEENFHKSDWEDIWDI